MDRKKKKHMSYNQIQKKKAYTKKNKQRKKDLARNISAQSASLPHGPDGQPQVDGSHPPHLPSPQQQQQQMQNVGGGPVRMMGHPGPGVMIHEPMQQYKNQQKMQGGPGQVMTQWPAVNMQQQQHQHMQQQQQMQNVGGGPVRMMGHPGPGVMIHEPMQQYKNQQKMQGGPGQVMTQWPAVNMQQQQHQHMVMPGQQQQMLRQQIIIRPANVVQRCSAGPPQQGPPHNQHYGNMHPRQPPSLEEYGNSLKKETIMKIVDIYRRFVTESSRTQDKIALIQHLAKLISHPAMQREVDWKASQLVFLAQWAYFTPTASEVFTSAAKETFHRALDHSSKKLEDLSTFLSKAFEQVNQLVPDSNISDEVKKLWNSLVKKVQQIQKKNRSTKQTDSWTGQVFLILYINMGFELFREPALSSELIAELDTCYSEATEAAKAMSETDPQWVIDLTYILLSLLSIKHQSRCIVVSVWSILAEHITPNTLQQVLNVIYSSKKETPLVDADEDVESDLSDEEESAEEEEEEKSEVEEDDGEDEFSDGMDEEETITDNLTMRIHEALGDSAALAFKEFRKARPVRKNVRKLPKKGTVRMHFRIRCLDLIEVLTDKELSISLSAATMMPLLSLLEVTVKEPLQKPLMDRTRIVLRKMTNIRRFTDSKDVQMEDLVKLLQILFSKPYAKKALMPYISDDLVQCFSYILRCALHLNRVNESSARNLTNGKKKEEPHAEIDGVYQLYRSNLSEFFIKCDSPVPFAVFSRALVYPWPDAGLLFEPLIENAFGPTIPNDRKLQAVQLLTALFQNSTAISSMGQQLLTKRLHSLLRCSQQVVEEAGSDSKTKYLNELFILLRVVLLRPEVAMLKGSASVGSAQLWDPFKAALTMFTTKGLGKEKDLKKNHMALARLMGLVLDETITAAAGGPSTTTKSSLKKRTAAKSTTKNNGAAGESGVGSVMTTTKKTKSNRPRDKVNKEAKKRPMVDHRPPVYYVPTPTTSTSLRTPVGRLFRLPSTERCLRPRSEEAKSIRSELHARKVSWMHSPQYMSSEPIRYQGEYQEYLEPFVAPKPAMEGMYNLDNSKRYKSSSNHQKVKEVSDDEHMVVTTTVTVSKGGPITATPIIENCPDNGRESDVGYATPRNNRKRSSSDPGITPNAPPQYLIESSWELPDGKTPVAIRRPSANPSASALSTHTLSGPALLKPIASTPPIVEPIVSEDFILPDDLESFLCDFNLDTNRDFDAERFEAELNSFFLIPF